MRPRHLYTNKIINVAIASVIEGSMPISRVPQWLMRDFGVKPAESVIRSWVKNASDAFKVEAVLPEAVKEFSGIFCLDETYIGKIGILVVCDLAQGDALVAFTIVDGPFDSNDIKVFLRKLSDKGITSIQVITDGSALYPDVIKDVWPNVSHQLCLFHVNQRLADLAKKAVRSLRSQIPKEHLKAKRTDLCKREQVALAFKKHSLGLPLGRISREVGISRKTLKAWLADSEMTRRNYEVDLSNYTEHLPSRPTLTEDNQFKPPISERTDGCDDAKRLHKALGKLAFTISRRKTFDEGKVQEQFQIALKSKWGHDVREIRDFMESWYQIWWNDDGSRIDSVNEAKKRWDQLAIQELPPSCQAFRRFQKRMTPHLFNKLTAALSEQTHEFTNNGAERYARKIKKIQKSRYRIRTKQSLEKFMKLSNYLKGTHWFMEP